jgi:glycosyltransferase involved in cell wall biosynthesis
VTRLCEAQRARGPVAIVTTGRSGDQRDWPTYRRRLQRAGVTHHAIDFFHRDEGRFWTSATALAQLIDRVHPAVIHAHAGVPCLAAVVARAMAASPARVIGQMYSWGTGRPAWMEVQDAWAFSQADRVVCSAREYERILLARGVQRRRLVYLPWGLPLEQLPWRGDAVLPAAATDAATIGFVGRIEPRKDQLTLVRACAAVRRTHPGVRLELVGPIADADYAAAIRDEIRRRGLAGAVTMTGEVADVVPYYRRWSLFVSLSRDEGQGLAALEAMAIGVPVVARRVPGIADFLDDGRTGFVVPGSSARQAAAAIVTALGHGVTARRIARHARRVVERRYAWTHTLAALDRLYRA